MSEDRDFDYVVGKLPRKDKDGNDTTSDRIGKGGRHRDDGTYSAVAYDLEVVDEDPTKVVPPEPQVIVQREIVKVEREPQRVEDLPLGQQIVYRVAEAAVPYVVDGVFHLIGMGFNAAVDYGKRKYAEHKTAKLSAPKKQTLKADEVLKSSAVVPSPTAKSTVPDEIDTLWLAIEEYRNENIIAIRYEKTEADGVVWDTDYVMNFNDMKMSIQLDRSYLEEALVIDPTFSTPHFITLLIAHGYLKDDGNLAILRTPCFITKDNIPLLANIINGNARYRLPVVYVSKTYSNSDPVDIRKLAGRLKGVAHVLVQESTWLNGRIRRECDSKNEYYGAIGVYFPNKAYDHKKYMYRAYDGIDAVLSEKVIRSVIQYSNAQMMDKPK